MSSRMRFGSAAFAAVTLGLFAGSAFPADSLAGLRSCGKQTDDAQRLACFDRELARLPASAQPAAAAAPAAQAAAAAAPAVTTPEEKFGYRGNIARKEVDERVAQTGANTVAQLTAVVTKIVTQVHGEMIITLDNGQVWAQKAPEPYFRLKENDKITIKPGLMSSFTLVNPAGRSTKVTRQQ